MDNEQPKRPPGRPPIQGRRVMVKLSPEHIKRALELGAGKIAAGVRKALTKGD